MTPRRGFTLVEVLLALLIMGVVTGAIYRLLDTNQRLSLAQAEQVSLQSNVRTGSLVVPSELRELNTWGGGAADRNDVIDADPDAVEYRASRGLGLLCQVSIANELRIADATWTGIRDPNFPRDDLYLFVDGDIEEDEDDTWLQVDVTGVAPSNSACGAGQAGWILTVPGVAAGFAINTPVRLFERMRLQLTPADGQWWLGARSISGGDAALTPVLGPLTDDGFALQYFDSTGAVTADLTAIKSIRITMQGLTEDAVRVGGTGAVGHPEETLATQVLLRNSIRPE
ncbi:MAG TPA: prepilin-type N-terminal cleavage/methylation domain-containing protein [Gemmatimonadales bacterium]|nr:prepilin-type N-terminal cleavage/methylation domain-containing protein [Gemmatimonadales bacterium]